jgi:hypothetical protein
LKWRNGGVDRYDEHAEFQIARRDIAKAWIEKTLASPDTVETANGRTSFMKCFPGGMLCCAWSRPNATPAL